jgi:RNA-binding protein
MDAYTRNFLRKRAHELKPIVMIGKSGLDSRIEQALDAALGDHELVKIKFIDYKSEKQEIARVLADHTRSEVVSIIGNIAILYREHEDPAKRRYHAPKRG